MALPKPDDELAAMAASVIENALPRGGQLAAALARDAAEMAIALNRLVGKLPDAILKTSLEVVGENRCKRWHKDCMVRRAHDRNLRSSPWNGLCQRRQG